MQHQNHAKAEHELWKIMRAEWHASIIRAWSSSASHGTGQLHGTLVGNRLHAHGWPRQISWPIQLNLLQSAPSSTILRKKTEGKGGGRQAAAHHHRTPSINRAHSKLPHGFGISRTLIHHPIGRTQSHGRINNEEPSQLRMIHCTYHDHI